MNSQMPPARDKALLTSYIPRQRLRPLQRPIAHFFFAYAKQSLEQQEPLYYSILYLNDSQLNFFGLMRQNEQVTSGEWSHSVMGHMIRSSYVLDSDSCIDRRSTCTMALEHNTNALCRKFVTKNLIR